MTAATVPLCHAWDGPCLRTSRISDHIACWPTSIRDAKRLLTCRQAERRRCQCQRCHLRHHRAGIPGPAPVNMCSSVRACSFRACSCTRRQPARTQTSGLSLCPRKTQLRSNQVPRCCSASSAPGALGESGSCGLSGSACPRPQLCPENKVHNRCAPPGSGSSRQGHPALRHPTPHPHPARNIMAQVGADEMFRPICVCDPGI